MSPGRTKALLGGADGIRTHDLLDAIEARSQLRHGPTGETTLIMLASPLVPRPDAVQTGPIRRTACWPDQSAPHESLRAAPPTALPRDDHFVSMRGGRQLV